MTSMHEPFSKVPFFKPTSLQILSKTQDLMQILTQIQNMFPDRTNVERLHRIYQQVLGYSIIDNANNITITEYEQILLNHRLLQYFIILVKENYISMELYQSLQQQTQKAEATIRSHIKIEQEMKMYMEYLEYKIENTNKANNYQHLKREIGVMMGREAMLLKDKINFIKKNQKLQTEIQILKQSIDNISGAYLDDPQQTDEVPSQQLFSSINNAFIEPYIPEPRTYPRARPLHPIPLMPPQISMPKTTAKLAQASHSYSYQVPSQIPSSLPRHHISQHIPQHLPPNLNLNLNVSIKPQISLKKKEDRDTEKKRQSSLQEHSKEDKCIEKKNVSSGKTVGYRKKYKQLNIEQYIEKRDDNDRQERAKIEGLSLRKKNDQSVFKDKNKNKEISTNHQFTQKKKSGYFPGKV